MMSSDLMDEFVREYVFVRTQGGMSIHYCTQSLGMIMTTYARQAYTHSAQHIPRCAYLHLHP